MTVLELINILIKLDKKFLDTQIYIVNDSNEVDSFSLLKIKAFSRPWETVELHYEGGSK